jgi:hypothetical protein
MPYLENLRFSLSKLLKVKVIIHLPSQIASLLGANHRAKFETTCSEVLDNDETGLKLVKPKVLGNKINVGNSVASCIVTKINVKVLKSVKKNPPQMSRYNAKHLNNHIITLHLLFQIRSATLIQNIA